MQVSFGGNGHAISSICSSAGRQLKTAHLPQRMTALGEGDGLLGAAHQPRSSGHHHLQLRCSKQEYTQSMSAASYVASLMTWRCQQLCSRLLKPSTLQVLHCSCLKSKEASAMNHTLELLLRARQDAPGVYRNSSRRCEAWPGRCAACSGHTARPGASGLMAADSHRSVLHTSQSTSVVSVCSPCSSSAPADAWQKASKPVSSLPHAACVIHTRQQHNAVARSQ